nr:DUF1120 domain-containing protein [Pseudomonas synxantha]
MKKIIGLTLGIACLAATLSAQATTSAQLVVRGTITPAACNLSLAGSGIIDYGTIRSGELSRTSFNRIRSTNPTFQTNS